MKVGSQVRTCFCVSLASRMEQRTEGCAEVPTAQEPHEPADLTERDGGEAGNAGKKALRNAVRRALLCGQCRYRGNTIPLASVGKIAHKDMIKSLQVSWDLLRLGTRFCGEAEIPAQIDRNLLRGLLQRWRWSLQANHSAPSTWRMSSLAWRITRGKREQPTC